MNVPEQVRPLLPKSLAQSLNVRNRKSKKLKFSFNTSEDALSWTVFRACQLSDYLPRLMQVLSGEKAVGEITIYYWGLPINSDGNIAHKKQCGLIELLVAMGEDAQSLSEPDIILEDELSILFIEVKFGSANDSQTPSEKWMKYDNQKYFNQSIMQVPDLKEYQLIRNWCIGNLLSEKTGKKFKLINLVFSDTTPDDLSIFKSILNQTENASFKRMNWQILLEDFLQSNDETWLVSWLETRKPKLMLSGLLTGNPRVKYNENEKMEAM
jgi:hypothetical protein